MIVKSFLSDRRVIVGRMFVGVVLIVIVIVVIVYDIIFTNNCYLY